MTKTFLGAIAKAWSPPKLPVTTAADTPLMSFKLVMFALSLVPGAIPSALTIDSTRWPNALDHRDATVILKWFCNGRYPRLQRASKAARSLSGVIG